MVKGTHSQPVDDNPAGLEPAQPDSSMQSLRQQAEAMLRRQPEAVGDLPSEHIQDLIHELQVHQVELEMQNEELRRTQREMELARDSYLDLYDFAPVGYVTLNETSLVQEANLTAAMMLGVPRAYLVGQPFGRFVHSEDQDTYYLHRRQLFATQEPQVCEMRIVSPDGSQFWSRTEAKLALDNEGQAVCRATISDISERKQAEEELQHLYEQTRQDAVAKTTLLQEIHHRVKNNLQIISSLLELQAKRSEAPEVSRALYNSQDRVRAMALVHEFLYLTPDLARLELGRYLQELLDHLVTAYKQPAIGFKQDVQVEGISVDPNLAIPCGLILTELVGNALKHAFPAGQAGTLEVSLHAHGDQAELSVYDDGVGLPAGMDPQAPISLGLSIVQMLSSQLKGQLKVHSAGTGTTFTVSFPLPTVESA